jgi:hypothetical protein
LTQLPAQSVWPVAHTVPPSTGTVLTQTPPEHAWLAPQTVPQPPQLFASVDVSTHVPPHRSSGVAHWHDPDRHVVPPPQTWPQAPQLELSELRSTHPPLHTLRGDVQLALQAPELQTWVPVHAVVQLPQWLGSLVGSTQVPPQEMLPLGHTPALLEQICVAPHAIPQVPQFDASLVKSTHAPLQF